MLVQAPSFGNKNSDRANLLEPANAPWRFRRRRNAADQPRRRQKYKDRVRDQDAVMTI